MLGMFGYLIYSQQVPKQQVITGPSQVSTPTGYQPFPLGTLVVPLKDAKNPNQIITTSTIKGKVYDVSVSDVASPLTPYLDYDAIDTATGKLEFTSGRLLTATSYKLKVWDDASTPAYYAQLILSLIHI